MADVVMDAFVHQLSELCRTHVTRAKWVLVPSHAIGRTIGERIALGGTNWLNLRFITPLDLALRMGAPFLLERGIDPSEENVGPALIMRLLLDLPREGGYFRPLADQPSMAQALWTTIRELRMARIRAADLKKEVFTSPAKHAELRALLAAYESFLVETKRGDMAAVYEEATKHPGWCPIKPGDCWTELPDVVWAPVQQSLLNMIPGERIAPRTLDLPGASMPRRLSDRRVTLVATDRSLTPLAHLLRVEQGVATDVARKSKTARESVAAPIHLFHAGGREAEIEEVFRRILATGAPLDQVEIACASNAHVSLAWEKAVRHDWPVTLGPGISATHTRPGRALIGWCHWIETDFSAGYFRRLLQSGDMGVEQDDEGFTAAQAARILGRAGAGWGRATYALALGRLRKSYESRVADPDESDDDRADAQMKADLTGQVVDWITGLVAAIPDANGDGTVALQALVEAAIAFVEHTTARKNALDHRAGSALHDHIAELRALGSFSCPLPEALRFIRERVLSLQVAPERPRPGHLHVCVLSQACYSGRPHLFVVGLEEGRVFATATEDAVLLDAERIAISPALRRSTDRIDESVHGVLTRLAAWSAAPPASVTFSFSCRDTREFRETYASWLMLQAFRLQQANPAVSYQDMKAALGEPKSIVSVDRAAAASSGAWWLRSVVGAGDTGVVALDAAFPGIAGGRVARAARTSNAFTEYDGLVHDAGAVLDPCAAGAFYSVTELEGVAGCPFRFFLKRGLGVRPVEERERDKDVWLDPLMRGAELHDLFALVLRRCRDENRRPDRKKDGAWLKAQAEARLRELEREMPPATAEILDRESKEFLADVELFLEAECEDTTSTPVGFEVSFGRTVEDDSEPLAQPDAVEIDLGKGLTFTIVGRIDRINKVGPASFEVLDYKTGGFYRDGWNGVFNGGRRLQHALYGLAAVELLRRKYKNPKVVAGVYYFPSRKGRRERVRIPAPGQQAIAGVLGDLRAVIRTGTFVHAPSPDNCTFCDYSTACDQSLAGRAEQKLEDVKLQAFGRLAAHV
jgi:ATP-dependent helicase/nuclease subunit B